MRRDRATFDFNLFRSESILKVKNMLKTFVIILKQVVALYIPILILSKQTRIKLSTYRLTSLLFKVGMSKSRDSAAIKGISVGWRIERFMILYVL